MSRLLISVSGGAVEHIYTDDPHTAVFLRDWDELESPEEHLPAVHVPVTVVTVPQLDFLKLAHRSDNPVFTTLEFKEDL